eukprot:2984859-Pleurochrysis_carterae.AAC.1
MCCAAAAASLRAANELSPWQPISFHLLSVASLFPQAPSPRALLLCPQTLSAADERRRNELHALREVRPRAPSRSPRSAACTSRHSIAA